MDRPLDSRSLRILHGWFRYGKIIAGRGRFTVLEMRWEENWRSPWWRLKSKLTDKVELNYNEQMAEASVLMWSAWARFPRSLFPIMNANILNMTANAQSPLNLSISRLWKRVEISLLDRGVIGENPEWRMKRNWSRFFTLHSEKKPSTRQENRYFTA